MPPPTTTILLSCLLIASAIGEQAFLPDFSHGITERCAFPAHIRNQYFSREGGLNTFTELEASVATRKQEVIENNRKSFLTHREECRQMQCNRPDKRTGLCEITAEGPGGDIVDRPLPGGIAQGAGSGPLTDTTATKQIQAISVNRKYGSDVYRFLLYDTENTCFRCKEFYIRTLNVMEFRETDCIDYDPTVERFRHYDTTTTTGNPFGFGSGDATVSRDDEPDLRDVCSNLPVVEESEDLELTTMFSLNPAMMNCRPSLEGVFTFGYFIEKYFVGECRKPGNNITSCPDPGNRFSIDNRMYISYRACPGLQWKREDPGLQFVRDTFLSYQCMGDWWLGKNHFWAVSNMGESRPEEKYRCFLQNRDDDLYLSHSLSASCGGLKSARGGPVMFRMTPMPVQPRAVEPGCVLPANYTGRWINTANTDSDILINATHIEERARPDRGAEQQTFFVCKQQYGNRYLMARLAIGGCQVYYVCFELVARHHNVIRYRMGEAFATDDFRLVCSWTGFPNQQRWQYNLMLSKTPFPVECPVAGKFKFQQSGQELYQTNIRGGITKSPRDQVYCKTYEADLAICPMRPFTTQQIQVDAQRCVTLDWHGKPLGWRYDEPDNVLNCAGYWRENAKSYLVTYEELDAFSKYRCWVYNRVDVHRVLMSKSVGSFCWLDQEADTVNYTRGVSTFLDLRENERLFDNCPMRFVDGSDPYMPLDPHLFYLEAASASSTSLVLLGAALTASLLSQLWH